MYITRREALRAMGMAGAGLLAGNGHATPKDGEYGKWWRGNLHMHTYWSDGRTFPEQAVDIYKNKLGYDFLAMSEHNIFADNKDFWKPVVEKETKWPPDVRKPFFDAYMNSAFGKDAQTRTNSEGQTEVRLRPYDEIKTMFEEPGRFLLMPGVEITEVTEGNQVIDGTNVHINYVNLPDVVPSVKGALMVRNRNGIHPTALIAENVKEVAVLAASLKLPTMLMLNHPQWVYLDILPENLINNPDVRFFEVCNGGSSFAPPAESPVKTNDQFWDTINAFRAIKGVPLIYGTGSDDTHYYARIADTWPGRLGVDYIVVRSSALTPDALLAAMHAGDFYASTGVTLDDIAFDAVKRTLSVKVQPAPDVSYTIRFITTKKNFDQTVRTVEMPAVKGQHSCRSVPIYSADIGKTVKLVEGTEASCTMAADDLYVRAKIESSQPSTYKAHFHPDMQVAWTQPYGAG